MVPVPARDATPSESPRVCIDQYEFPNLPCEYPVVWVRAAEAAKICTALGKRLCDAHEWEGACSNGYESLEQEYSWSQLPKGASKEMVRQRRLTMEYLHNKTREVSWAYGETHEPRRCAIGSKKSERCAIVDFSTCGTNNFPAGSFPECVSESGVYDQHGNAAEHMSIPLDPGDVGGRGWTEMKGSWFAFGAEEPHPDDCHWRAKNWHTTRVRERESHRNYHLGFRCCRDL
jgi:formylglycine-generating enzyme required for sulfatase activity